MSVPRREGRITVDPGGEVIDSSVEHLYPGDPVRIEDNNNNDGSRTFPWHPEKNPITILWGCKRCQP